MKWDKSRPYAVFRDSYMCSYSPFDLEEGDLDEIYEAGELDLGRGYVARPFDRVPMRLRFADMNRGRSSTVFWWEDGDGHKYPMFPKELTRLLRLGRLSPEIDGIWSAEKRGNNFGIWLHVSKEA